LGYPHPRIVADAIDGGAWSRKSTLVEEPETLIAVHDLSALERGLEAEAAYL
jgi:hypothetical protein